MTYDEILIEMEQAGLEVRELPLRASDGLIHGRKVAIRQDIPTQTEKAQVAAEELAHHRTAAGDLSDYTDPNSWKLEVKGRRLSYDIMIGLSGLVKCYEKGCRSAAEAADVLDVTPQFFAEAIDYYRAKHGRCARLGGYLIFFEPALSVLKLMEVE